MANTLTSEILRKYQAIRFPFLKKSHLEDRKKFAADMLKKEDSCFDKFLRSDETKIELFDNNYCNKAWREPVSAYNTNNTLQTMKYGGCSIMVRGFFSSSGTY